MSHRHRRISLAAFLKPKNLRPKHFGVRVFAFGALSLSVLTAPGLAQTFANGAANLGSSLRDQNVAPLSQILPQLTQPVVPNAPLRPAANTTPNGWVNPDQTNTYPSPWTSPDAWPNPDNNWVHPDQPAAPNYTQGFAPQAAPTMPGTITPNQNVPTGQGAQPSRPLGQNGIAPRTAQVLPGASQQGQQRLGGAFALPAGNPMNAGSGQGMVQAMTPLAEIVAVALYSHPSLSEALANRRAVSQELQQAQGKRLPSIDVQGGAGFGQAKPPNAKAVERARLRAAISLTQLLYDGGQTVSEIRRQAARADGAALRVRARAHALALDVVKTVQDIRLHRELAIMAQTNSQGHEELVNNTRQLEQAGRLTLADVQQAEERLQEALLTQYQIQENLDNAVADFINLVGENPERLHPVPEIAETLPASVMEAIQIARQRNMQILIAWADLDATWEDFRRTRGEQGMQLTFKGNAATSRNNPTKGTTRDISGMLEASYNIYQGGGKPAKRQERIYRIDERTKHKDTIVLEEERDLRKLWNSYRAKRLALDIARQRVLTGQGVLDAYRQQFDLGQRGLLDVLDAQAALFNSSVNATTRTYDLIATRYELHHHMGTILDVMGLAPPPESLSDARARFAATP
ncbi:MAG: TolC family protein [Pseudomonadota bacterium]